MRDITNDLKKVMNGILEAANREELEAFPVLDIEKYFKNGVSKLDIDGFNYWIIKKSGASRERVELELKKYVNDDQNLIIMESDNLQAHLSAFFRQSGSSCTADEARRVIRRALSYSETKKSTPKTSTIFSDSYWFHYLKNLILFYHYGSVKHSPFRANGRNPWVDFVSLSVLREAHAQDVVSVALKTDRFLKAFKEKHPKYNPENVNPKDLYGWIKYLSPEVVKIARKAGRKN
jgi:hypothetical protein